jgi:hypothetical protein
LPFDVAPWVAIGALVLAVLPLLSAGAEKEILAVSSADMVERNVPTTVSYVQLTGLAMSIQLPAPGGSARPPYGLLVRDAVGSDQMTVVMTDSDPLQLRVRAVVARVQAMPYSDAAAAAFTARGDASAGLGSGPVLVEASPSSDETVSDISSAAEVATLPNGALVRLPLRLDGEAVAICALADGGCADRVLARGEGVFAQLAHDNEGIPILVQTIAPTSAVAGTWQGAQVRNEDDLGEFAESLPVRAMAGWGRILVLASIQDDPALERDRSWLGPVLLLILSVLLWLGGRVGYPSFRPALEGARGWSRPTVGGTTTESPDESPGRELAEIAVVVSGHGLTTDGRRRHLDETIATLRPADSAESDGRLTAALVLADSSRLVLAAHEAGRLGSVERGDVTSLTGVRPALWAHWYGTDLRMNFASAADRDRAAELISGGGPSVRSSS